MTDSKLIYQISRYIQSLKGKSDQLSDEQIDHIVETLDTSFSVEDSPENFAQYSYSPVTLTEIFEAGVEKLNVIPFSERLATAELEPSFTTFVNMVTEKGFFDGCDEGSLEYLQRQAKLVSKFSNKAKTTVPSKAELEALAEEKKSLGNTAMTAKDYEAALGHYTEAIEFSPDGPNSHIYYSNRAAAYCFTNQHELSVLDCEAAIALKSDYAKAYSRLGFSNFFLQRYEEAVDAYEKVVALEPSSKEHQEALRKAKKKLERSNNGQASISSPSSAAPDLSALAGLPGMDGIMKNPKMLDALNKAGGMDGITQMMKDPKMMSMAQNFMKDPKAMQQAMAMFGGDGAVPDMAAMATALGQVGPEDLNGPTAGSQGPSSRSSSGAVGDASKSKGGKVPFKGFE